MYRRGTAERGHHTKDVARPRVTDRDLTSVRGLVVHAEEPAHDERGTGIGGTGPVRERARGHLFGRRAVEQRP
jgi:hypothetical protein